MTNPERIKMKTKPTTLRSILDQSFNYALQDIVEPNAVSMIPKQHLDQAEQAIKSLMLSKLPEKKYVSEDEDPAKAYDDLVHQGYNQAIEEITKIIKEI